MVQTSSGNPRASTRQNLRTSGSSGSRQATGKTRGQRFRSVASTKTKVVIAPGLSTAAGRLAGHRSAVFLRHGAAGLERGSSIGYLLAGLLSPRKGAGSAQGRSLHASTCPPAKPKCRSEKRYGVFDGEWPAIRSPRRPKVKGPNTLVYTLFNPIGGSGMVCYCAQFGLAG